jgi:16S rRNA processing protein RimM
VRQGGRSVALGRIVGAHGIRGELRVVLFGDGPENLARAPRVSLAGAPEAEGGEDYEIGAVRPGRSGEARLSLVGISDRDAALALRGLWVLGEAGRLAPLEPGEHYWHELVGCAVVDVEGRAVGVVREIWATGAHDLLVVEAADGRQHLLPTAQELLKEVGAAARRIVFDVVPGLLDPL